MVVATGSRLLWGNLGESEDDTSQEIAQGGFTGFIRAVEHRHPDGVDREVQVLPGPILLDVDPGDSHQAARSVLESCHHWQARRRDSSRTR